MYLQKRCERHLSISFKNKGTLPGYWRLNGLFTQRYPPGGGRRVNWYILKPHFVRTDYYRGLQVETEGNRFTFDFIESLTIFTCKYTHKYISNFSLLKLTYGHILKTIVLFVNMNSRIKVTY